MKTVFTLLRTTALLVILGNLVGQICPVTPGTELINNGNFEAGNTGFTNAFTYCTPPCGGLGGDQYTVSTNPNNQNSGYFRSMADHTPGAGTNMLVFDFNNNSTNDPIYSTSVNVVAGKVYFFSAWFANIAINNTTPCPTCPGGVFITNSPILKFRINGVDQGTVRVDSLSNNWNQFFTTWTAAASGSITIEIINLRGGNASNDLAIDDISFTDGCEKITNLNTLGMSSGLIDTVKVCNFNFPYALNPGLPGTYGYSWRNSAGSLLPGLNSGTTYTVNAAPADNTKYYLCYEFIAGCPRMDSVIFKTTPLSVELGPPKVMCAPVNIVLNSGVTNPPVAVQWTKNSVNVATTATYTATDVGTYGVTISRPGCGSATDAVVISNPTSSIAGSGTYCNTNNTASFSVTSGSTQIKWFTTPTGGTALNPSNTNATINLPYTSTNTSTPGCLSGLYAEDKSSYPGTLLGTAPCGTSNTSNPVDLLIEVNQTIVLNSFNFFQNTGWGPTGTFSFSILNNNPTGGPHCGTCSPAGTKDGPGATVLYSETSPSYTVGGSATVRTFNLTTPQSLSPGRYWLRLQANTTALGVFDGCTPSINSSGTWSSPYNDNTGNSVVQGIKSIHNNNVVGSGAFFNIGFQVGASNPCSRLFICATLDCPAPVELSSFTAVAKSAFNEIRWTTASETQSDYFILEKSLDGQFFESIDRLSAAGNSTSQQQYSSVDKNINESVMYYRLKQVDQDGSIHYSEIIQVTRSGLTSMLVYPNPANSGQEISLLIYAENSEWIQVECMDITGKKEFTHSFEIIPGKNIANLPTSQLPTGMYVLKVMGTNTSTTTFVIE